MRLSSLDAVRGIAALQVVLTHCIDTFFPVRSFEQQWWSLPLRPLLGGLDGRGSVIIFFVLSGFVLTISIMRDAYGNYASFVIKRLCRIYLPFAVVIIVFAAVSIAWPLPRLPGFMGWFNWLWSTPLDGNEVLKYLALTNRLQDVDLDPPIWSLAYELRISLVFPFLALLVMPRPYLALVIGIAVSAGCLWSLRKLGFGEAPFYVGTDLLDSVILTFYFVIFFIAGIAMAAHLDDIKNRALRGNAVKVGLALVAFFAFYWPAHSLAADFSYGVGACAIIALSLASPTLVQFLERSPLQWCGRVSYSLYLIHLPLIVIGMHLLDGRVPPIVAIGVSILAALVLADISYRYLEIPAIELGRRLALSLTRGASQKAGN